MTMFKGDIAKKALAWTCSIVLCVSLMPARALGAVAQSDTAAEAVRARAEEIDAGSDSFEDGEMIVVFRDSGAGQEAGERQVEGTYRSEARQSLLSALPGAVIEPLSDDAGLEGGGSSAIVELPDGMTVGQAVARAEREPGVLLAQPNHRYWPLETDSGTSAAEDACPVNDPVAQVGENDPGVPNQWWLRAVDAFGAWSRQTSDNAVTVAVVDTGCNFEHEDLVANILADYAYDAVKDAPLTESATEPFSHGCHVAGIVAGVADNGVGIAGMSYNANILPINVFQVDSERFGPLAFCDDDDIIRAYDYLLGKPDGESRTVAQITNTRVVNMSLGGYLSDSGGVNRVLERKIAQAKDAGILTVAAGGNGDEYGDPITDPSYPSDFDDVMSVIALETPTQRAQWSDYNAHKNIAAPGVNIYSTYYGESDSYGFMSGTSMASPLVAGCAALLFAHDGSLSVDDVKEAMYSTAVDLGDVGYDSKYGWGRVNPERALAWLDEAHVMGQTSTMTRTSTQTLSVRITDNAAHNWLWTSDDPEIVSVSDAGELLARAAGSTIIRVQDADNPALFGTFPVTVEDISIPGAATLKADGAARCVTVSWPAAEYAIGYQVYRASGEEDFELVGAVASAGGGDGGEGDGGAGGNGDADSGGVGGAGGDAGGGAGGNDDNAEGSTFAFTDSSAGPNVEWRYYVVPVGSLDGEEVTGIPTEVVATSYRDKAALSAAADELRSLRAETKVSADGEDVLPEEWWVERAYYTQLNVALRKVTETLGSASATQDQIDAQVEFARAAADEFLSRRKRGTFALPEIEADDIVVADAVFTGEAVRPDVTVTHDGVTLVPDTDYSVRYEDNEAPGVGVVIVTGIGEGYTGYAGEVRVQFAISDGREPEPGDGGDSGEESGGEPGGDSGNEPGDESGGDSGGDSGDGSDEPSSNPGDGDSGEPGGGGAGGPGDGDASEPGSGDASESGGGEPGEDSGGFGGESGGGLDEPGAGDSGDTGGSGDDANPGEGESGKPDEGGSSEPGAGGSGDNGSSGEGSGANEDPGENGGSSDTGNHDGDAPDDGSGDNQGDGQGEGGSGDDPAGGDSAGDEPTDGDPGVKPNPDESGNDSGEASDGEDSKPGANDPDEGRTDDGVSDDPSTVPSAGPDKGTDENEGSKPDDGRDDSAQGDNGQGSGQSDEGASSAAPSASSGDSGSALNSGVGASVEASGGESISLAGNAKAANTIKVSSKAPIVKKAKLSRKARTIAASKAFKVTGARGAVTFHKASGSKKLSISKKGKVTVKKGTGKGVYKAIVRVTAAGDASYESKQLTVTLKIKVK